MTVTPADLARLPKAEIHVHLEGTARPATLEEFLSRTALPRPAWSFHNLDTFVEVYSFAWRTMFRPGDYARLVREYCEDAARCGVRYAELQLATAGRPYSCLAEAAEAAENQSDVVVRFVVDVPRSLPVDIGWAMLEAARDVPSVVAVGLAGPEREYPPEPFAQLFAEARRRGLRSGPHAGEDAGPESVRSALTELGADRIQHGIRAVEDGQLLAELAQRRIPLGVCLTSNLQLGVVSSIDEHPLKQLWDAGVVVSVNTDDPGFFGCDLVGEYALAGRLLELDREGYGHLALNSVEASFAPEWLKAEMRSEIGEWVRAGQP